MNERRQYYADHGICYNCGQREAEPNRRLCFECGEKAREHNKKRYYADRKNNVKAATERKRILRQKRKEQGLCVTCGKRPPLSGIINCGICKGKRLRREHAKSDRLPQDMRGDGLYCYQCCRPICNGTKLCEDCRKRSAESAAYARTFINKENQIWRKLDSANVAEIHYKARSESDERKTETH